MLAGPPATGRVLTLAGSRVTTRSVLIGAAVFAAAFGLLARWVSRRKGVPLAGLTTFLGIGGVYLGFWGVMKSTRWLYICASP